MKNSSKCDVAKNDFWWNPSFYEILDVKSSTVQAMQNNDEMTPSMTHIHPYIFR